MVEIIVNNIYASILYPGTKCIVNEIPIKFRFLLPLCLTLDVQ